MILIGTILRANFNLINSLRTNLKIPISTKMIPKKKLKLVPLIGDPQCFNYVSVKGELQVLEPNTKIQMAKDQNPGSATEPAHHHDHFEPKEKSSALTILLVILISSGNYFYGYYIIITNVLAEALLVGVYGQSKDEFKANSRYFGFLFSLGCFLGLISQGKIFKRIGGVKLMMVVECFNIVIALVHLVKSFGFLLILRVLTGVVAGISLGVIPPLLHDMFSCQRASLGGIVCYIVVIGFLCLGASMDKFFGGVAGLTKNYQVILWWPSVFGAIRLILMLVFVSKMESPSFWIDKENLNEEEIKGKLAA